MSFELKPGVYKEFVKVDKHGNKTYRTNACKRCGGLGRVFISNLDNGRCFGCGGSGITKEYKTVEYTPEQRQLRLEKATAKRLGTVAQQYAAKGLNADGVGYIPRGNTYPIKDRIKADGGVWNTARGWIMPIKPDYIDSIEIRAELKEYGEYVKRTVVTLPPAESTC
ncbi:MAG: hypothetical protein J5622_01935 [Firmicutes bacterium]|nr:hypothetical protein [Bacillota bacterium]